MVSIAETFRAAFERIAASRDREEAEEAYGEFEETLEDFVVRLEGYEAALLDARRYVVSGTIGPDDLAFLARIDSLLAETGAVEERVAELRQEAGSS